MQVVGPETLADAGAAMAGVIALGFAMGFATHCVSFLSILFMRFVDEGSK